MSDDSRDEEVRDLMPAHWDHSLYGWAVKIRDLVRLIPMVKITGAGTGPDRADFSFKVGEQHFRVYVESDPRGRAS